MEKLGVLRKFHTSNQYRDKITFYRGQDNNNGTLTITRCNGLDDVYDLRTIELLSLSTKDGVVVHYDTKDNRSVHPYRFNDILDVEVNIRG